MLVNERAKDITAPVDQSYLKNNVRHDHITRAAVEYLTNKVGAKINPINKGHFITK